MRTAFELRKDFNNPDLRHLCVVKGNYLDKEYKDKSFVLNFDYKGEGFTNTGNRVRFEELVKNDDVVSCEREKRNARVLELNKGKLSYAKISEELKKEGIQIEKSTVGKIIKN